MVAIIYSFVQSGEASKQNFLVQDALNKITSKVEEVILIKQELQSFREDSQRQATQFEQLLEGLVDPLKPIFELVKEQDTTIDQKKLKQTIQEQERLFNEKLEKIKQQVYTLEDPLEADIANFINDNMMIRDTITISQLSLLLKKLEVQHTPIQLKMALHSLVDKGLIEIVSTKGRKATEFRKIASFQVLEKID